MAARPVRWRGLRAAVVLLAALSAARAMRAPARPHGARGAVGAGGAAAWRGVSARGGRAVALRALRQPVASLLAASLGLARVGAQAWDAEPGDLESQIAGFDADGDGYITQAEFFEGARRAGVTSLDRDPAMKASYVEVFALMDRDGDGRLDMREAADLAAEGNDAVDGVSQEVLAEFDALRAMGWDPSLLSAAMELVVAVGFEAEAHAEPSMPKRALVEAVRRLVTAQRQFSALESDLVVDWMAGLFDVVDLDRNHRMCAAEVGLMLSGAEYWWFEQGFVPTAGVAGAPQSDQRHRREYEPTVVGAHEDHGATSPDAGSTEAGVARMLDDLDVDLDGGVDLGEFLEAADPSTATRAARLFASADADGDGWLSRGELARLLAAAYG